MISIEEIKQIIIKNETGWIEEIHTKDEAQMYIDGMKEDINKCETLYDIVSFYHDCGYTIEMGWEAIVALLRENTQIKDESK